MPHSGLRSGILATIPVDGLQGYLAHKKTPPRRTLQNAYAYGPMVAIGRWAFSYERGTPVRRGILATIPADGLW